MKLSFRKVKKNWHDIKKEILNIWGWKNLITFNSDNFKEIINLILCTNLPLMSFRSTRSQMLFKTSVLKNFEESLLQASSYRPATLSNEYPTQMLSIEYCEIFKSSVFYRTPQVPISVSSSCSSCCWESVVLDLF